MLESEDEAEYLRPTFDAVGELVPVLVTVDGQVIDGKHRLALNPNWEKRTLTKLNDPVKAAIARLVINIVRRRVSGEEQQIAQSTGMSYSWVMKYLPSEFKIAEKAEAGKVGGIESGASRREAKEESEDIRQPSPSQSSNVVHRGFVNCEKCHVGTLNPQEFEGHMLCPVCFEKVQKGEIQLPRKSEPKLIKQESSKPQTSKVKEPWENRKAKMQPQISRMEEAILTALNDKGIHPETNREFCLQSTIPDLYFPKQNLAIYLDGEESHKNREDRDTQLRELLTKRYGIRVVSFSYRGFTQTEQDKILSQLLEEVSNVA